MPAWDEAEVASGAARLRLVLAARRHGAAGARLGRGPGASLEFHDHRAYAPGDDLRHLDWAVYARTDQLVLRRQRQEVAPRLELLIDGSASLAADPRREALATGLAALLATLAEAEAVRPRVWWFGAVPRVADGPWRPFLRAAAAAGAIGFAADGGPLIPGAERILVSDGLCPGGGAAVVRRLGAGAGRLCLVQVLTADELAPVPAGAVRLVDVEGGEAEQMVDAAAVAGYQARLARHQDGWRAALAGRGAGLVTLRADEGFAAAVRRLVQAGVVEPRQGRT